MHTVPLSRDNLYECAVVAAAAYARDPFFAKWLHPYPSSFPDHDVQSFTRSLKLCMHTPRCLTEVMVSDASEKSTWPPGTVLGLATWFRLLGKHELSPETSDGRQAAILRDRWPARSTAADAFERWALGMHEWYHMAARLDRRWDRARLAAFKQHMAAIKAKLRDITAVRKDGTSSGGSLYLGNLVVDPQAQRRGIGSRLLQQGLHFAKQEQVPVGLAASGDGEPLYLKNGFVEVGTDWVMGEKGSAILVYWPPGLEISAPPQKFKVVEGKVVDI